MAESNTEPMWSWRKVLMYLMYFTLIVTAFLPFTLNDAEKNDDAFPGCCTVCRPWCSCCYA
ncbi:Hypothetical predicted protein [Paramuricea clavata]|uniref:Uncharacterized protein n=1 Tax=Paramuricea clavata TaxID=317549 RepID=A0A6S7ITQ4_PARCT|nr:Hypothetical predicted protein [Paramuricea clavata]